MMFLQTMDKFLKKSELNLASLQQVTPQECCDYCVHLESSLSESTKEFLLLQQLKNWQDQKILAIEESATKVKVEYLQEIEKLQFFFRGLQKTEQGRKGLGSGENGDEAGEVRLLES